MFVLRQFFFPKDKNPKMPKIVSNLFYRLTAKSVLLFIVNDVKFKFHYCLVLADEPQTEYIFFSYTRHSPIL